MTDRHLTWVLGATLLLSACSGGGSVPSTDAARSEPVAPAVSAAPVNADLRSAVAVAHSESTNRLTFLDASLRPLSQQVQLETALSDVVAVGRRLVVGFPSGALLVIDGNTGKQVRRGQLNDAALGRPGQILVDQLFAAGSDVLVAGRVGTEGDSAFEGFVQRLDVATMRATYTRRFARVAVQDLELNAQGQVNVMMTNGDATQLDGTLIERGEGQRPSHFLSTRRGFVRLMRDPKPAVSFPNGKQVSLVKHGGPIGLLAVPAGCVVLLGDANTVIGFAFDGSKLFETTVDDLPYSVVRIGTRLLIGQANGASAVVLDLASGAPIMTVPLDHGVDRVLGLGEPARV